LVRKIEGPNGIVEVFEVTPPGMGLGEIKYEIEFLGSRLFFLTVGEAMVEAEAMAGLKKS
jgi:hypothetical protein